MLYEGNRLNEISFPIGGIGSGCIGLAGNGELVDWEIFNRPHKKDDDRWRHRHTHFALRVFDKNRNVIDARVLVGDRKTNYAGSGGGVTTACMNGLPHFENNTFDGEYPVAKLDFYDKNFPARVQLKAYNPMIPLDSKNSSIPGAFFEITLQNNTDIKLTYEAAFSVRNPFSKSENKPIASDKGIMMSDGENPENNLTVATDCEESALVDYWYRGWRKNFFREDLRSFWDDFSSGRELKCRFYKDEEEEKERTYKYIPPANDVCTVSGSVTAEPCESKTIRFVLTWSIPQCFNYWNPFKDEKGKDITWKNYYSVIFKDSAESAAYSLNNLESLCKKTEEFTAALYSSTVDEAVKEAVGSALSVLKSPTVMRLEDGSLYGFEGADPNSGSCPGLCQHVWNYAYVCCYLFPDLEIGIRNNEFKYGVLEDGETIFRIPIPFGRKDFLYLYQFNDGRYQKLPCVDGQMGIIIKAYREWKFSGNDEWLKENWETLKKVLEYAWSTSNECEWDKNRDGVLEGRQHHTLDVELFGPSAWLEGYYLAALKAATEMAEKLGDFDAAEQYRSIFEKGREFTVKQLFNGEYFIQRVDLEDKTVSDHFSASEIVWNDENNQLAHQIGEGCLIDQLCGQWHSGLCGLGDIFDATQAKTAALNIYKNNFRRSMRDFVNPWRLFAFNDEGGTVMCSYPENVEKPKSPIPYCEEVMSGFEYAFAGVLMMNGYPDEAHEVVREVRKRYDGEKRNPWNDIECGSNYARSMSAFALLPIICGFVPDLPNKRLSFSPRTNATSFKNVWFTAVAWGSVERSVSEFCIDVKNGSLELAEIRLDEAPTVKKLLIDGAAVAFEQNGDSITFATQKINRNIRVVFE